MAIYDYLPTYTVVEPNNLKGLQPGFVVAQMEVAESAKEDLAPRGMMANGCICGISAEGIIRATSETKVLFLHFTEPLRTLLPSDKYFAVEIENENPRLVQLIPGDEWMSDVKDLDVTYAGRIVKITSESGMSKDDWFKVTTLADGTEGYHYMYLG